MLFIISFFLLYLVLLCLSVSRFCAYIIDLRLLLFSRKCTYCYIVRIALLFLYSKNFDMSYFHMFFSLESMCVCMHLISLEMSFLFHGLLGSLLFRFQIFALSGMFLLFPFWSNNILSIISIILKSLIFILKYRTWSILE